MRKLLVVAGVLGLLLAGCGPSAQDMERVGDKLIKQAQEGDTIPGGDMAAIPKELIQMMKDQGVMDKFIANARVRGQNPGLKVSKRLITEFVIGLDGTYVEAEAEINGTGTQLPAGTRLALLDTLKNLEGRTDPDAVKLRDGILQILGWNRVTSDHNPTP